MFELITVILSFALVPLLGRFRIGLWASLTVTAIFMALINGLGFLDLISIFAGIFTDRNSLNTVLVIAIVAMMSTMMKVYGILDKIVDGLSGIISDKRYLVMIVPALIGCLVIPGGAIVSAPFVFALGGDIGMSKPVRVASNLVFRHISAFLLPYSAAVLLTSSITGFQPMRLMLINSVYIVPTYIAGYFMYLRKLPPKINVNKTPLGTGLRQVLIYSSPIYACIVVHAVTGLPLYISMAASLVMVFLLGPRKGFFTLFIKSFEYKITLSVVGVLMIQGVVTNLDGLINIFGAMFQSGTYALAGLFLASMFFGFITGFQIVPLGIVLPMLIALGLPRGDFIAYVYLAYCGSYIGYYFSPLHMCQIFTNENMGVSQKDLYLVYRPYFAFMLLYLFISYFALSRILPILIG